MNKLLLTMLCVMTLCGCEDSRRISGKQFQREIEEGAMATMAYSKYLGQRDGKVYLERQKKRILGKDWKKEILFAEVEDVDPEFLKLLKKTQTKTATYLEILQAVARDIEGLKSDFPQLEEFSPAKNLDARRLVIDYGYHTHQAGHAGGWTAGVPNPDDDGVWFYIDIHDPDSTAQIHTQPVTSRLCAGKKQIQFLILEGEKTSSLSGKITAALIRNGIKPCD